MIKKMICAVLLAAMLITVMSGCNLKVESLIPENVEKTEVVETTYPHVSPTPCLEPATVNGVVLYPYMPLYGTLTRGESFEILDELNDDYYCINYGKNFLGENMITLVEKRFIKTDEAETFKRTVYALENAAAYENAYYVEGSEMAVFTQNSELSVIDEFHGMLYVSWTDGSGEHFGYMTNNDISEQPIAAAAPSQNTAGSYVPNYSGSGDSGSSSGGSNEQPSTPPAPEYGYEGEDINIGDLLSNEITNNDNYGIQLLSAAGFMTVAYADNEKPETITGYAFTDGIPVYVFDLEAGSTIEVLEEQEESDNEYIVTEYFLAEDGTVDSREKTVPGIQVYVNGCICEIPECYVRTEAYGEWDGFIQDDVIGYTSADLSDEGIMLNVNEEVEVVDCVLGIYVVADKEGNRYYVLPNGVSDTEYVSPVAPVTAPSASGGSYTPNYGDSSGGSNIEIGGSSGGGSTDTGSSGGGSDEIIVEWTDPVL